MQDYLITIPEGARQLGISERRLRRTLHEPELQAKLSRTGKQVGGRERAVMMIPPELMTILQERFEPKKPRPKVIKPTEANVGQQTGITMNGNSLVNVYQRLVSEKNIVVDQQSQRVRDLQYAIDYERNRSKRVQLQGLRKKTTEGGQDIMISTSLAAELWRLFSENHPEMQDPSQPRLVETAETTPERRTDDLTDIDMPPQTMVRIYEMVLLEKDLLIEQQQQRISDLHLSLEHERDQATRTELLLEVNQLQEQQALLTQEGVQTAEVLAEATVQAQTAAAQTASASAPAPAASPATQPQQKPWWTAWFRKSHA